MKNFLKLRNMMLFCFLFLIGLALGQRNGPPTNPAQNFQECIDRMEPPQEFVSMMNEHRKTVSECLGKTSLGQCAITDEAATRLEQMHKDMMIMFTSCILEEKNENKCNNTPAVRSGPRSSISFGGRQPPQRFNQNNGRNNNVNSNNNVNVPYDISSFPQPPRFNSNFLRPASPPPPPPHGPGPRGRNQMIEAIADEDARNCFLSNSPPRPPMGPHQRNKRNPPPGHGPECFRPFCKCAAVEKCEIDMQRMKEQIDEMMKEECLCLTNNADICEMMGPPPPPPCFDNTTH